MNNVDVNLNDPIAEARKASRRIFAAGGVVAMSVLAWALWPARSTSWENPTVQLPGDGGPGPRESAATAVDAAAYRVAIWVPPPLPPVEPPKPQQIALKLQLIGIHREHAGGGDMLRATLYDPATDRIHIVADGDKLGVFTITGVTSKGVDLSDGSTVRSLALDTGGKAR